jgi:hypothetical protein
MKQVDELIRGELSAIQSYDVVLKRLNNEEEKRELSSMREDHVRAVDTLKRYSGAEVRTENNSGPWGAFTQAFAGGASLFGDKAAVQALKIGEEYGIKDYKQALESDDIDTSLKEVIRSELLPNQERHISRIEGFLQ